MIEDVANLIKKSIDSSLRDEFDTLHEHRYRYTLSVCRSTLKRNIDEAFHHYIKGGHGLLGDMDIIKDQIEKVHGKTYDEIIHECAGVGVKEKMLDRDEVEKIWVDTFKGSKVTIKKRT